jgi:predicted enzyme related to lactoylglutathione lyase
MWKEAPVAGFATLIWVDLECADPPVLAEFYHQVRGWEIIDSQAEYAVVGAGGTRVRFGRVDGYQAAGWPSSGPPQRYHLDLQVDDVVEAIERCLELGAGKPEFQPGGDRWTVLTDPAGHPFCLCPAQAG